MDMAPNFPQQHFHDLELGHIFLKESDEEVDVFCIFALATVGFLIWLTWDIK